MCLHLMEQLANILEKLSKSGKLQRAANILTKSGERLSPEVTSQVVNEERKKEEQDKHQRE